MKQHRQLPRIVAAIAHVAKSANWHEHNPETVEEEGFKGAAPLADSDKYEAITAAKPSRRRPKPLGLCIPQMQFKKLEPDNDK